MKNLFKTVFFFGMIFLFCHCQLNDGSSQKITSSNMEPSMSEKRESALEMDQNTNIGGSLISMGIINDILRNREVYGLAFDLTDSINYSVEKINVYEVRLDKKTPGRTPRLKVNTKKTSKDVPVSSITKNPKGEIPTEETIKFEFNEILGRFDFAFFTRSQLNAISNYDYLLLLGTTIDFGQASTMTGKFFTLRIEGYNIPIPEKLKARDDIALGIPAFADLEAYKPKPKEILPNFNLGIPCPPDWNPDKDKLLAKIIVAMDKIRNL